MGSLKEQTGSLKEQGTTQTHFPQTSANPNPEHNLALDKQIS